MYRVQGIVLHVNDIEKSLAFWQGLLELRTNFDVDWTTDSAVSDAAGLQPGEAEIRTVGLIDPSNPVTKPGPGEGQPTEIVLLQYRGIDRQPIRGRFQDPGTIHIGMWVEDFDACVARLVDAGHPLVAPVSQSRVGNVRLAMFADPDGFMLEFLGR